jgi:hypothetical protein
VVAAAGVAAGKESADRSVSTGCCLITDTSHAALYDQDDGVSSQPRAEGDTALDSVVAGVCCSAACCSASVLLWA